MKNVLLIVFFALILASCHEKPQTVAPSMNESQLNESLEKANRYLVNDEEEDIENYVRRHQWNMVSTGTGLRYEIVRQGDGPLIQAGQLVTMEYVLYDIFGDVVYSSENNGVMRFVVGQGAEVAGLDEAVRHLHRGDLAHVIVPSHLGYGLLGDQKSVPSRATLIYTLKIIEVQTIFQNN